MVITGSVEKSRNGLEQQAIIIFCKLFQATCFVSPYLFAGSVLLAPESGFNPFAIIQVGINMTRLGLLSTSFAVILQSLVVWFIYESVRPLITNIILGNLVFGFISLKDSVTWFSRY